MLSASEKSMDPPSQPSSPPAAAAVRLGGRAIDRHNPIIRDGRRFTPPPSPNPKSSSSHHHTNNQKTHRTKMGMENGGGNHQDRPEEQNHAKKTKKNKKGLANITTTATQGSSRYLLDEPVFFDGLVDSDPVPIPVDPVFSDGFGNTNPVKAPVDPVFSDGSVDSNPVKVPVDPVDDGSQKTEPGFYYKEDRLILNASKHISSSFLEKKKPDFFNGFLDYDPIVMCPDYKLFGEDKHLTTSYVQTQPPENKPASDQVVVLRVSLHCKGCAVKVRKHLSRMKGVTSFNVDFAAKKVTVMGEVTPLGVLASVSKVKNAQFWPQIN
ncbi:PREDICTED: protein SODIUM POTASSIUM ROOT DEFECTIVE 1-like [Tarenaya hassleriana]|uniref:protein SODIUM POTASSIUM ROOT DEFECTIVE 1-like n=1 Tax=Tarenaya hassleriana TaxID=28532 RepID=UPI00053C2DD6|nr:PREDICTED: protein SODIUM POTASSIUM ROOT DEFECTIVE 1-like [Tarenaya hassleriana]XP_010543334.1 PREDICTED: protein SODIUM POTASSIUM ROOT DEFECTIVE 1-like [Tarenaya hassleriana]